LPRRRWKSPEASLIQAGGWLGPNEVIVPRADCLYRRLHFPGIPQSQRSAALGLAAARLAPEPGALHVARWQGEVAHVWILPAADAAGWDENESMVVETAILPLPTEQDGERLIRLQRGFEGQIWRAGVLAASRWWDSPPTAATWQVFLRAGSVAIDSAARAPSPLELSLQPEPWGQSEARLAWTPAQLERLFWRVVVASVAFLFGWQMLAWAVWSFSTVSQDLALASVRSASAPLIAARERAETARDRMIALTALKAGPVDYVLMADARRLLPEETRVTTWFRDDSRLRLEVQAPAGDPRVFVQAFREHPLLSSVVANPLDGGLMQLDVDLEAAPVEPGLAP